MEAESADLKETQMMINHDEKIYQEYIRALLFDTEQASLPRDQLSGGVGKFAGILGGMCEGGTKDPDADG